MDYRFFESVDRYEITIEDITLKQYGNLNPETIKRPERIDLKEVGSNVTANYHLQGRYETEINLTAEQIFAIKNAIRSLMLLKGEKCIDEQLITKFIKKTTGIKVKNFTIVLATKKYSFTYRTGGKYQSDEIDLTQSLNKKNPIICEFKI